jgi:hypothetical protein
LRISTFAVIGVVLSIHHRPDGPRRILFSANNFETALLLAAILLLCGVGSCCSPSSSRWKKSSYGCTTAVKGRGAAAC